MPQPSSLLATFFNLSESLKAAHTHNQPVNEALVNPYGPQSKDKVPLTRELVRESLAGVRDVLVRFRTIWDESGEDGRVRGAGKMKEWTQTTFPLLSLAPALHHLSTSFSSPSNPLFPSQTPTPFALPPTSQPAALLERTAKALGLEVFRETTLDNTSNTFSSLPDSSSVPLPTITKEVVVLGGKALGIELELLESSEDQGTWTLAKFRCSLTLEGGPSDHHLAGVDELLGSSLRRLLELMKPAIVGEQTGEGETRELQAARELKEFERRLRQVVRMEGEGTQGDLFSRAEEIKSQVDGWLQSNGCGHSNCSLTPSPSPYPIYLISPSSSTSPRPPSHKQVVHLVPTSPTALPPRRLPSELLALAADADAFSAWGWEAVFEPALVIGVRGNTSSWGPTLLQQARSLSTPLSDGTIHSIEWDPTTTGSAGNKQRWSFAETPSTEGVAVSRVVLSGIEEAGRVIEWARAWSSLNEFWLGAFDGPHASPSQPQPEVDLDDFEAFFSAAPPSDVPLPITFHLILPDAHSPTSSSTSHLPSLLLSLPHPTLPLLTLEITLTPTSAGPLAISVNNESIEPERLRVLGERVGGWAQGVVGWVVRRLGEGGELAKKRAREESEEESGGGGKRLKV